MTLTRKCRRRGVSQIMKAKVRNPGRFQRAIPAFAYLIRPGFLAMIGVRKDKVSIEASNPREFLYFFKCVSYQGNASCVTVFCV